MALHIQKERKAINIRIAHLIRVVTGVFALMQLAPALVAQITQLTNETATPVPGVGHDYRHFLQETVSPVNGSVSLRIAIPTAASRGLTQKFSIDYDSAGVNYFTIENGYGNWASGDSFMFPKGGWSYNVPILTSVGLNYEIDAPPPGGVQGQPTYCPGQYQYMFTDIMGGRHSFPNLTYFNSGNPGNCPFSNAVDGDSYYRAKLDSSGNVRVSDLDGTVYTYLLNQGYGGLSAGQAAAFLPSQIEDRNGNQITSQLVVESQTMGGTFTDSAGRTAVAWNAFGTTSSVTVAPLGSIQVTWGTAPSTFSGHSSSTGNYCFGASPANNTHPVIATITLPDNQTYNFHYDATYGLVDKITYPNGAYSRYVWGFNSLSDVKYWATTNGTVNEVCAYSYDTPAIIHHYVSYDGVNEVLQEDYAYQTQLAGGGIGSGGWASKTTTVTTTVKTVQNGSLTTLRAYSTTYTYTPTVFGINQYGDPYDANHQLALEQSEVVKDGSGKTLRTEAKSWAGTDLVSMTTTLDDGSTSQVKYTPIDVDPALVTYSDFGVSSPGPILKQIAYTYQPFGSTANGGQILDRPCKMIVSDGSNNQYSETDYYYDGGSSLCSQRTGQATAAISGLTNHDETNYGSSAQAARGNVTKEVGLNLQTGDAPVTAYSYDESGQLASVTEANGNLSSYSFLDSYNSSFGSPSGQTNAYLTRLTRPQTSGVAHVQSFTFRYNDGQLDSSIDENGRTTSYAYNDPFLRPSEVDYPDGGKITTTYNDSGATPSRTTNRLINSSTSESTTYVMDGAGHVTHTQLTSDPQGTIFVDTVYEGTGKTYSTSNPYRTTSDAIYGLTKFSYDALGRTTTVTSPDNTTTTSLYAGPNTTTTDQAGCSRQITTDGTGRLTKLIEDPAGSSTCNGNTGAHLNYQTLYSYDPLDDLRTVTQSGQTRTFQYDSLRRLLSATNPESGTVKYSYDAVGNLLTKTDSRQIVTCYGSLSGSSCSSGYDALSRPTLKSYSDGTSPVSYQYDTGCGQNCVGHLVTSSNSNSTTRYLNFDPLGRVGASIQTTLGQAYQFSYIYDLAGDLVSETYPSGRKLAFSYDAADRISSIAGTLASATTNYVVGTGQATIKYWPTGVPSNYTYANGLATSVTLNNRLQATSITAGSLLALANNWGTSNNNGDLRGQTATASGTSFPTQSFYYDGVNRLSTASESGGWSRQYGYDAFGNICVYSNATGGSVAAGFPVCSTTTGLPPTSASSNTKTWYTASNQLTASSSPVCGQLSSYYDCAGDMTQVPLVSGASQTYDAENRILTATGSGSTTYLYDGDGHRVAKQSSINLVYVYDAAGSLVAEYNSGTRSSPLCTTCFVTSDHLGSTRLVTSQTGTAVGRHDYFPFGDEIPNGIDGRTSLWGAADTVVQKFTGKERDQETGLDYFGARYYGSALGRFTSPDWSAAPVPVPYAKLNNPQSLNLYTYVLNNPLSANDPTGHILKCEPNGTCPQETRDQLAKIAPGTKVDADGTVHKAGALQRAWNHVSGHGEGQSLISSLVNSSATTSIESAGSGVAHTVGNTNGAVVQMDPSISASIPTRIGGDQVSNQPVDPAAVLAHELIHALHDVTGTNAPGMSTHDFTANGQAYHEVWKTEELNTVGFRNIAGPTENGIRSEFGENPRATYLPEEAWIPGP
jgi:RHS repeat-associated protein